LSLVEETAVVSAISAILLAVFAVIQLKHMEKHRNVDVSMRLFEWAETETPQSIQVDRPELSVYSLRGLLGVGS